MKKSKLKQIIKEVLLEEKGYSNFIPGGETSGLDKKTLDSILLRIAKGEKPTEDEHSVARGNHILDKADPENVAKITRGEDPYVSRMQELAGLQQEIKVNNPTKIGWEIEEDDDDGEDIIISLSKDEDTWWGHIKHNEPNLINVEFLLDDEDGDEYEIEQMDKLTNLLDRYNKPYKKIDVNNDGQLIYIQFEKD